MASIADPTREIDEGVIREESNEIVARYRHVDFHDLLSFAAIPRDRFASLQKAACRSARDRDPTISQIIATCTGAAALSDVTKHESYHPRHGYQRKYREELESWIESRFTPMVSSYEVWNTDYGFTGNVSLESVDHSASSLIQIIVLPLCEFFELFAKGSSKSVDS